MATLPNMGIILPTLGASIGEWDDKLNAGLTLVDAHDHTTGKGTQVPSAGININADLSFGGFTITSLGKISFTAIAAPSSGSKNLFVNTADNELYWRTNAGANVKLTSGTSINTTLVGGIVGDYSTVGAEVAYDDANDRYTFKQQTTKPWARVSTGGVELYEFNTTESVFVRLIAPAALGASYDITFPAAVPGAQSLLQMSTAGVISASNTIAQSVTFSDVKLTANHDLVLSTASYLCNNDSAAGVGAHRYYGLTGTPGGYWEFPNDITSALYVPLPMNVGDRIGAVTVYITKNSDATNTLTATLYKVSTSGVVTSVGTANNSENAPGGRTLLIGGLTETVSNGFHYVVRIGQSDATPSAADRVHSTIVSWDRP